jgi:hypothetical protein
VLDSGDGGPHPIKPSLVKASKKSIVPLPLSASLSSTSHSDHTSATAVGRSASMSATGLNRQHGTEASSVTSSDGSTSSSQAFQHPSGPRADNLKTWRGFISSYASVNK